MKLNELSPAQGSAKAAWRKGRGPGSGNGKTAGKGRQTDEHHKEEYPHAQRRE